MNVPHLLPPLPRTCCASLRGGHVGTLVGISYFIKLASRSRCTLVRLGLGLLGFLVQTGGGVTLPPQLANWDFPGGSLRAPGGAWVGLGSRGLPGTPALSARPLPCGFRPLGPYSCETLRTWNQSSQPQLLPALHLGAGAWGLGKQFHRGNSLWKGLAVIQDRHGITAELGLAPGLRHQPQASLMRYLPEMVPRPLASSSHRGEGQCP